MADLHENDMVQRTAAYLRCLDAAGNSGVIPPSNLLDVLSPTKLVKRIKIPYFANASWIRFFELRGDAYCLFSLSMMPFSNVIPAFVIGYMLSLSNSSSADFKILLGELGNTPYAPDLKYKRENDRFVLWIKSVQSGNGYLDIHFGSLTIISTEETPPDDAIRPQ